MFESESRLTRQDNIFYVVEISDGTSNVPATFDSGVSILRFYVYVLFSLKDHKFYIGFTTNFKKRLTEHANGKVKSTSSRRSLKLIYYEAYSEESDARKRVDYLKGGNGKKELKIQLHYNDSYIYLYKQVAQPLPTSKELKKG